MTLRDRISNEYFEWICDLVCGDRFAKSISYRKLLTKLHQTEFVYSLMMDENRAKDGINFRYRFSMSQDCEDMFDFLDGPCSVLEMMIALCVRFEEETMDDPAIGDRTAYWFWGIVNNLGLGSMTDENFDKQAVEDSLERFLYHEYEPDGKGGLFRLRHCNHDLRKVDIWTQMCWYMDELLGL